jgi:hypothetical protein
MPTGAPLPRYHAVRRGSGRNDRSRRPRPTTRRRSAETHPPAGSLPNHSKAVLGVSPCSSVTATFPAVACPNAVCRPQLGRSGRNARRLYPCHLAALSTPPRSRCGSRWTSSGRCSGARSLTLLFQHEAKRNRAAPDIHCTGPSCSSAMASSRHYKIFGRQPFQPESSPCYERIRRGLSRNKKTQSTAFDRLSLRRALNQHPAAE